MQVLGLSLRKSLARRTRHSETAVEIPMTQTLLQIAGVPSHPSPVDRSALILIDPQLEYLDGLLPLEGIDAAVSELKKLSKLALERSIPTFYVLHQGRPGAAAFDPEGPHVGIIPQLAPRDDETIIIKSLPNAFAGTNLHELLQDSGRTELIIAGFATHMCVSATTRAALDFGYRTTVVANATATRDLPNPIGGETILARTVHEAALAALADRFAIVVLDTAALETA